MLSTEGGSSRDRRSREDECGRENIYTGERWNPGWGGGGNCQKAHSLNMQGETYCPEVQPKFTHLGVCSGKVTVPKRDDWS